MGTVGEKVTHVFRIVKQTNERTEKFRRKCVLSSSIRFQFMMGWGLRARNPIIKPRWRVTLANFSSFSQYIDGFHNSPLSWPDLPTAGGEVRRGRFLDLFQHVNSASTQLYQIDGLTSYFPSPKFMENGNWNTGSRRGRNTWPLITNHVLTHFCCGVSLEIR